MSESIYDWIEREPEKIVKPPMYRSGHSPKNVRVYGSTFGSQSGSNKTFGKVSTKSDPHRFLKSMKNRGVSPKSKRTYYHILATLSLSQHIYKTLTQTHIFSFQVHAKSRQVS